MGGTSPGARTPPHHHGGSVTESPGGMPTQEPWEDVRVMSSFSAQTLLGEGHVPPARGVRSPRTRQAHCLTLKPRSAAFQLSQIPPRPSLRVPLAPGELRRLPQQEDQRFPQNTHSLCPMTCPAAILPDSHSVVPPHRRGPWGWGAKGASVAGAPGESITALSLV